MNLFKISIYITLILCLSLSLIQANIMKDKIDIIEQEVGKTINILQSKAGVVQKIVNQANQKLNDVTALTRGLAQKAVLTTKQLLAKVCPNAANQSKIANKIEKI